MRQLREWLKANGGPPAVVILGVAVLTQSVLVGVILITIGLVLWIYAWGPVSSRLPSLGFERLDQGSGVSIRFLPAEGGRKRRLQEEINSLAADMFAALKSRPMGYEIQEHMEASRKMDAAADEAEKSAIWAEYDATMTARSAAEQAELQERFGARMINVVLELKRCRQMDEREASKALWQAKSWAWLGEAAQTIAAAGKRL